MTISNLYEFVNLGCSTSTPVPLSAFPDRLYINKIYGISNTGDYLLGYNPLSGTNTLNHVFPNTTYLFISNTVPYTIICPTPTPTPTPSPTPTPTPTISVTPTNTPSPTPTNTPTVTPSPTPTNTLVPTNTPTPTPTNTPTPTPTNTPSPTPTETPVPTDTPTPTPTNTPVPVYNIRRAGSNIYGESSTGNQMNSFGNITGSFDNILSPKSITYLYTFALSTGTSSRWLACGRNTEGQLGVGDNSNKSSLTLVNGNWNYVGCAGPFTVAISAGTNLMFATGVLSSLQANIPTTSNTFTQLTGNWSRVFCGDSNVFALSAGSNDRWFTTGKNLSGELGLANRITQNGFNIIPGNWSTFRPGYNHTFALSSGTPSTSRRWYATGSNSRGQLGVSDTADRTSLTVVHVITSTTQLVAGSAFTVALSTNGTIQKMYGTGANNLDQLGFVSPTDVTTFTQMTGDWGSFVGAGLGHTIALSANSSVLLGTGYNEYGQLGLGDTTTRGAFSVISGSWTAVGAGSLDSFALLL